MSKYIISMCIGLAICLSSCYSSLPAEPPCFSDGSELRSSTNPNREGAMTVERCCLTEDDCKARFTEASMDNTLRTTPSIIDRFSVCEPFDKDTPLESFEDLTQEYGTCVLDIHSKNSECRTGADCAGSSRCCPAFGDKCTTKFGEDVNSCTICQEEACDVL